VDGKWSGASQQRQSCSRADVQAAAAMWRRCFDSVVGLAHVIRRQRGVAAWRYVVSIALLIFGSVASCTSNNTMQHSISGRIICDSFAFPWISFVSA
jgi:hypothetical protein